MAKGSGGTRSGTANNPKGVGKARVNYGAEWSQSGSDRKEISMRGSDGYMTKVFMKDNGNSYRVYTTDFGNGFNLKGTARTFTNEREAKEYAEGLMKKIKAGEYSTKETKNSETKGTTNNTSNRSTVGSQPKQTRTVPTLKQFQSQISKIGNVESIDYHKAANVIEVSLETRKAYGDSYTRILRANPEGSITLQNTKWKGNSMSNNWATGQNTPGLKQEHGFGVLQEYMKRYGGKKNAPSIIITQYYD